jgi:ketosteroid isomerase-like protein
MSIARYLSDAINRHDLEAFVAIFVADYRSEQPVHPRRAFTGRDTVRLHWSTFFAHIPDFTAEIVATTAAGDDEWVEWRWHGTQHTGEPFDLRGVVIIRVRDGMIASSRLYMEPVETISVVHELGTRP